MLKERKAEKRLINTLVHIPSSLFSVTYPTTS